MRKRSLVLVLFCTLFAPLASRGLGAQVLVRAIRGLAFGTVIPGVPLHILRTDPVNSGQFEVRAPPPKIVVMTLTLPAVLTGPLGATMPLSFATNDAGFSGTNSITSQVAFNPYQNYVTIMFNNRVGIFLGGTASPTVTQAAGAYTGTVVMSVIVL